MLLLAHIAVYCLSLFYLAHYRFPVDFDPTTFNVFCDPSRLGFAPLATGSLVLFAPLFVIAASASVTSSATISTRWRWGFCG